MRTFLWELQNMVMREALHWDGWVRDDEDDRAIGLTDGDNRGRIRLLKLEELLLKQALRHGYYTNTGSYDYYAPYHPTKTQSRVEGIEREYGCVEPGCKELGIYLQGSSLTAVLENKRRCEAHAEAE